MTHSQFSSCLIAPQHASHPPFPPPTQTQVLILSDEHPNVVRCFAMEEDREFVYLALERCRTTLSDLLATPEVRSRACTSSSTLLATPQVRGGACTFSSTFLATPQVCGHACTSFSAFLAAPEVRGPAHSRVACKELVGPVRCTLWQAAIVIAWPASL